MLGHACTYKTMNMFFRLHTFKFGCFATSKICEKKMQWNRISAIHHKLVMFEDEKNRVKTMSMQSSCLHSSFSCPEVICQQASLTRVHKCVRD